MISVGKIVEGAFALVREHFTAVAIWAGIYLAGNLAVLLVLRPMMQQATNPAATADMSQMASSWGPFFALNLLLALVGIMLYTAAMRAVLRPQAGGVAFLRVGMDELRTLGLVLLFAIVGAVVLTAFALIVRVFVGGMAVTVDSPAVSILLGIVVGLLVFGLFLFLMVRFSLAFPLSLHRGRIVIGEAWSLSRGRFWKLFGAALVVTVIGWVLSMVVASFAMGSYFSELMAVAGDPEASEALAARQMAGAVELSPGLILQSVASAAISAFWIALSGGSVATAAKLLLDNEFEDAEQVFG